MSPRGVYPRPSLEDRFWAKVDKQGPGGCWLWRGSLGRKGYGQLMDSDALLRAHRVAYELEVGPIPPGLVIDHLCRVTSCVNPAHLEPVTHAENCRRALPFLPRGTDHHFGAKTHCPKGHPYDEANTYLYRGKRACRECRRTACRAAYHARRAAEKVA